MGKMGGELIGTYALILKGVELIFILIIALTMAKVPNTFYWVPDLFAALLSLGLVAIYCPLVKSNSQKNLDRMLCALFTDLMISICLSFQIFFISITNLYATSAAGKIIAQIFSFTFIAGWLFLCYAGYDVWYSELPPHRKNRIQNRRRARVQRQPIQNQGREERLISNNVDSREERKNDDSIIQT